MRAWERLVTATCHHVGTLSQRVLELASGNQPEDVCGVVHHLGTDLVGRVGQLLQRGREQEDRLAEQSHVGLSLPD